VIRVSNVHWNLWKTGLVQLDKWSCTKQYSVGLYLPGGPGGAGAGSGQVLVLGLVLVVVVVLVYNAVG